ncbi:MAG: ParA family protein [Actinomycetota bacterium]
MDSLSVSLNRFVQQNLLTELFPPDHEVEVEAPPIRPDSPGPGLVDPSLPTGRIVAVVNQRAKAGKTVTAINLGAALCEEEARVLAVDLDPQGTLSARLGLCPDEVDLGVYELLLDPAVDIADLLHHTAVPGLDLIPCGIDLAAAEFALAADAAGVQVLKTRLESCLGRYNYVLIDCPPSLGLLTVNALTAAGAVLAPVDCETFSVKGMSLLLDVIHKVKWTLNPELIVLGILATMSETGTEVGSAVMSSISENFPGLLFKTVIHKATKLSEVSPAGAGEPALVHAPQSGRADEYRDMAREVLLRGS